MPEDEEERFTLRYSRERRLRNAPRSVKDMYEEKAGGKRPGFLSFLTRSRSMKITFGTVIAFALMALLFNFLTRKDSGAVLGPYRVQADAVSGDGSVALSIRLSASAATAESLLTVRSSLDGATFVAREFALSGARAENLFFRIRSDADVDSVECLISLGDKQIGIRVPVKAENARP